MNNSQFNQLNNDMNNIPSSYEAQNNQITSNDNGINQNNNLKKNNDNNKMLLIILLGIVIVVIIFFVFFLGDNKNNNTENVGNGSNQQNNNKLDYNDGELTLDMLNKYPESPESDFQAIEQGNGELVIIGYIGNDEIVVIPNTIRGKKVTSISSFVFANNSPVKAIKLSDSITSIMKASFGLNKSLEIFVAGKNLRTIGEASFQGCSNLHTVVLNDGLKVIEGVSFGGCDSLTELEIPDSVTEIQPMTFYNSLPELTIIGTPGSVAEQTANKEGIKFKASK